MRSALLGLVILASSTGTLLSTSIPASAQVNYGRRPSHSFTPSQSNTRYEVYQNRTGGYGSHYGGNTRRNSNRGYGHSSGSYFGW